MKITVEKVYGKKCYGVKMKQGVQTFYFAYYSTKKDCQWYAKMVRKALKASKLTNQEPAS